MPPRDPSPLLDRAPVVPVLTIVRLSDAVPLARALVEGGLPVIEVTLRTPVALEAIKAIAAEVPEAAVGAGTVLAPRDVDAALAAGAHFLVSPGTPAPLAAALAAVAVPALPGCATVTEAMALAALGFRVLKFFPAEPSGGAVWLKAVSEPLPHICFCPTGGINAGNAARYLALPNVVAVGGSWVAPRDAVAAGDFRRITQLAREAGQLAERTSPR
jgi:2-dehydro-3-deoxyphosphogluconate aldolase/(4S)-4-hydroxy-2-oxoglutarate aldolase